VPAKVTAWRAELYLLSPRRILSAKRYRKLKTLFLPGLNITATKVQQKKLNIKTQIKNVIYAMTP